MLVLKPDAVGLVTIPDDAWDPGQGRLAVTGSLDSAGQLTLGFAYSVSGNLGVRWRGYLAAMGQRERRQAILEALLPDGVPFRNEDPQVLALDDWHEPLTLQVTAASSRPLPADERAVYLPRTLARASWSITPAVGCGTTLDLRRIPSRHRRWRIDLPDGLTLAAAESLSLDVEGMRLTQRVWQEERTLVLERAFHFEGTVVDSAQVASMRQALDESDAWQNGYFELRRPDVR